MLSQFWNNIPEASAGLILFGSRIGQPWLYFLTWIPEKKQTQERNTRRQTQEKETAQELETEGDEERAIPNKDEEEEMVSTRQWWSAVYKHLPVVAKFCVYFTTIKKEDLLDLSGHKLPGWVGKLRSLCKQYPHPILLQQAP